MVQIVEDIEVRIYSCEKLEKEISAVIQRPKLRKKLGLGIERYISFLRKLAVEIELDERFDRVRDIKDNYIIDLAFASKCSHVVTGDPDLPSIKHVGNIQIISLAALKRK